MRCEVADGVVSPEIRQGFAVQGVELADPLLIKCEDRQQLNGGDAKFLEVRDLLDNASKGAWMLAARGRRPGKATHMHLVNDGLTRRPMKWLITLPVILRCIDDRAAHRGAHIVIWGTGCCATPERVSDAPGVRI